MTGSDTGARSAAIDAASFREAMRQLAGGVSIITIGKGEDLSGLTVTSVTSLSAEPPTVVFCINRSSSSWPVLHRHRIFAVNVIAPEHQPLADSFSGRNGAKGKERLHGAHWLELATGAPVLADAVAALDCEVEELIERHTSAIVIGRVVASRVREAGVSRVLTYWRGAYGTTSC